MLENKIYLEQEKLNKIQKTLLMETYWTKMILLLPMVSLYDKLFLLLIVESPPGYRCWGSSVDLYTPVGRKRPLCTKSPYS